ncbi:FAD-dependent monooxygenase [Candidatus Nitrotoga arctica]|uniref:2-octaprenyl-6-methoxyphenol hydroxylase n=1 Tax=Candidatus Nitrotoga arctica TaxID=453162 RepID=A0ABN8AJP7_9PROT|nr:FAD-dependent monooxygenase [Candidatus Nitrotoga arctica]CAG9931422.1 2-octaprenyl-6-methoxyphenol hydroxylase [Candidatus Nitrotoga arctica]
MNAHCDIAIIGGGPVGTALMLALRDSGLQIVMLEARKMEHVSADPRALALSSGSRQLLERLGVWKGITQVSLIKTIHVSQKNSFGRTLLRAKELKVPELGYVLPYTALQNALQSALKGSKSTCLTGAVVTQLQSTSNGASIHYQHAGIDHQLEARLAVVADGGKLLEAAHPPEIRDYGQSAVIAHVTCTHPQPDIAFERFTMQGPLALLPFRDGYELVWTAPHEMAQEILRWNDAAFLAQLHQHFGDRAGKFLTIGERACFPLRLKRAPKITLPHTVLIGNAAQTLHPVAGQGFNMGLRDAWELAQEILNCAPETLGSDAMLTNYRKQRQFDRQAGIHFTDGLVRLFSNDLLLLKSGRAAALTLLDCLPGAKKFVARRMMFGTNG